VTGKPAGLAGKEDRVAKDKIRIGVMAPGSPIATTIADRVREFVIDRFSNRLVEIYFHPQCFLASGHFAGDDSVRARAFLDIANDESFAALWFARGGYGACRIAEEVIPLLSDAARSKAYLGYSDAGSLLAALYKVGLAGVAHGPMPVDITRKGGDAAVGRALAYLIDRAPDAMEASVSPDIRTAAFNMAVLSQILATPLQPDLSGHVLMLEEVSEHMYRIDRLLFHITGNPGIRKVSGIMLGRCSSIPANDPDFGQSEEQVVRHWCGKSGIPYLGRADIGHDVNNKVVPFGRVSAGT
jgi:muramoyltetrapeptide carboxypeptidase